jgi:phage terminase large subunit-like protein
MNALPDPKLKELLETLEAAAYNKQFYRSLFFKPYPKQLEFYVAGLQYRERLFMAGNQVGKTYGGAYEAMCHATGDYPSWWPGKVFARPTRGWCAGVSSLAVRDTMQKHLCGMPGVAADFGTGLIPKKRFVDRPSLARGVTDAYDTLHIEHRTKGVLDGVSTIHFKSYEQGRPKFQGDTIDWGWGDEEGPKDIYDEFLTRLRGDGIMFLTFTPLFGKTPLIMRFLENTHKNSKIVSMTIDDAEHWTAEEKAARLAGYAKHERDARARGIPLLGTGLVFDTPIENITEPAIKTVPPYWKKLWAIDFGIGHPFAAVLMLWDVDTDTIHIHHTYRMADQLPLMHAAAMVPIGQEVPVAWPQDGTQRRDDGKPLAEQYRKLGLKMLDKHATFEDGSISTEAGILEMDQRMKTGRFKVASHLSDWLEEYGSYHRKEGDIVKERDDLMSATRVGVMARRFAKPVLLGGGRKKEKGTGAAEGLDFDYFA